MLHDRILIDPGEEAGERKSAAGIVIPATATMGKRLVWGEVVAAGPHVRQADLGDTVLYDPEDRAEVELEGRRMCSCVNATSTRSRARRAVERGNVPLTCDLSHKTA